RRHHIAVARVGSRSQQMGQEAGSSSREDHCPRLNLIRAAAVLPALTAGTADRAVGSCQKFKNGRMIEDGDAMTQHLLPQGAHVFGPSHGAVVYPPLVIGPELVVARERRQR